MRWREYPQYKSSGVGWLGEIPAHWEVKRIKNIGKVKYGLGEPPDQLEAGLPFIRATDIHRGKINSEAILKVDPQDIPWSRDPELRTNDILVVRSGAYTGDSAIVPEEWAGAIAGYDMVLRVTGAVPQFVAYALLSKYLLYGQIYLERSRAAQPHLNAEELGSFIILSPTRSEQEEIATCLNSEMGRIDALVEKKQRQIELLQEKRAALISHAVTKGLNPDVKMKDSAVEWLGHIPMHWEVKKVKFLAGILRGKFSHRPRNDPQLYDGPYPFIQTGDIVRANKYINDYQQTLNELGFAVSKEFPRGTLVMSIAANIGDLAILEFPACFPDSIVGFFPKAQVDLNYLYYNLESMKQELKITAPLNTQQNLNIERIGPLQTVSPPINEQRQIAVFLDQETAKMEGLIAKIQESLDRLKEYRTALISAAMTGRIDVREGVA